MRPAGESVEVAPDWSTLKVKGTPVGLKDWVTSEAMGCTMLAIFTLNEEASLVTYIDSARIGDDGECIIR